MGWRRNEPKSEVLELLGFAARLRVHQFQLVARRVTTRSAPILGLTHSQSIPAGGASVPLVSTAT